jgi:tetratricopeptide (TPR) repeat protein
MTSSKRKDKLNVILKTALAAIEKHPYIKIPATLISAIAGLPDKEQEQLAKELQRDLLTQSEMATLNAADAAATAKRIERFLHEHYPTRPLDSITYIPYPRNDYFTGRKDQLEQLAKTLKHDTSAIITQTISGLGGVGKTQIALEYAYAHQNNYNSIIWLRADTEQTITADLEQIMQKLNLPSAKLEQNRANLIRWLTEHQSWLLVFDNADDPERIVSYLPPQGTGHILITSRATDFQDIPNAQTIPIDKMTESEAVDFLFKRTDFKRTDTNKNAAEKLAGELDYLPLALEQAAAYIVALKITFEDYLDQYASLGTKIFKDNRARARTSYNQSVHNTWQMNIEQIKKESPASVDLLNLTAFLHPDSIPFFLIIESAEHLSPNIATFKKHKTPKVALAELLEPLTRFSLITRHTDKDAFSIHRLLQQVIRDNLNEKDKASLLICDLDALYHAYPRSDEFANWPICAHLTPHCLSVFNWLDKVTLKRDYLAEFLNRVAYYLDNQAQLSEAEPIYQRALAIDEASLGKDHPNVATDLNNLAGLYQDTNRLKEAEPLMQRALAIDEASFGKDHPKVAIRLNNLAGLHQATNRLKEAEPLMERHLVIFLQFTRRTGHPHPHLETAINNYTGLLIQMGYRKDEVATRLKHLAQERF